MANRDTAKTWFETGDKPTQQQFSNLFDWLRFLDDNIGLSDVTGLNAILGSKADNSTVNLLSQLIQADSITISGDDTYQLQQGRIIQELWIVPSADITLRIGTYSGGDDILPDLPFPAGEDSNILIKVSALTAARTLYLQFIGPAASTQIFIYKR